MSEELLKELHDLGVDIEEMDARRGRILQRMHQLTTVLTTPPKPPILEVIRQALIERGFTIDPEAKPNESDELHEFIGPEGCGTFNRRFAWLDALILQMTLDEEKLTPEDVQCTRCGCIYKCRFLTNAGCTGPRGGEYQAHRWPNPVKRPSGAKK